jgi:hypothetical protein
MARLIESHVAPVSTAGFAMCRLIDKMLVMIPRLLSRVPQKLTTTIGADQPFVGIAHFPHLFSIEKDLKMIRRINISGWEEILNTFRVKFS